MRDERQIMKKYADKRFGKDYKCYPLGQKVLVLRRNPGKLDSKWERDFYTVIGQFGPRLGLRSQTNQTFCRHTSDVRPYCQPGIFMNKVIHK